MEVYMPKIGIEIVQVQVEVINVYQNGKHGPYAVAHHEEMGSITFSLDKAVWTGELPLTQGEYVCLSQLRKMKAGWRAKSGRRPTSSE
jgi:hypothetical protein